MGEDQFIITGSQRSCTTFISECLNELGHEYGSDLFDEDIQGGHESDFILSLAQDFLGERLIKDYEHGRGCSSLKYHKASYLMMFPDLLQEIYIRYSFKFLIIDRNKNDVFDSKKSKPRFDEHDSRYLKLTAGQMRATFEYSLKTLNEIGAEYLIVPFGDIYENSYKIENFFKEDGLEEVMTDNFDFNKIETWKK